MELIKALKELDEKLQQDLNVLKDDFENYKELLNSQLIDKADSLQKKEKEVVALYEQNKTALLVKADKLLKK